MRKYVQYGCGFAAPSEWINYDSSLTLRFEKIPLVGKLYIKNSQRFPINVKYGDITKGLPEADESCDGIYSSHILEHLTYSDFQKALINTFRLLKQDGIFRCVVPDLKQAAIDYLVSYEDTVDPAHQFLKRVRLGSEGEYNSLSSLAKNLFGNTKHLWMWDEKTLTLELKKAGFSKIRSCQFNDCEDSHFSFVEEEGRFYKAVSLECKK